VADINTGTPLRYKNGGRLLIGSDVLIGLEGHGLVDIVQGSFERHQEMEGRNILRETIGDERPTFVRIRGKCRYSQTAPGGALNTLRQQLTDDNVLEETTVTIQVRKGPANASATQLVLNRVTFEDITYNGGGGEGGGYDTFELVIKHLGPCPDYTDATIA
jgi:hypothetical protein